MSGLAGRVHRRSTHGIGELADASDGFDQQLADESRIARRDRQLERCLRSAVQLGWTPSSRAGAAGETPVLDLQQAVFGQPIEMMSDQTGAQFQLLGSLLAGHPAATPDDEEVQVTACGVAEGEQPFNRRSGIGRRMNVDLCFAVGHPAGTYLG